jgi:hypothetical protein
MADWGASGLILGDPFPYLPLAPSSPHVTICSVYSRGDLRTRPNTFHMIGSPRFVVPAAPKDGFTCLRIYPGLIRVINQSALADESFDYGHSNPNSYTNENVDPRVLAKDIINYTAGDMPLASPGRMLGVGIIAGDLPTAAEYLALMNQQTEFFRFLVTVADTAWSKDRDKEHLIGTWHRIALEELGDNDLTRHPWRVPIRERAFKSCPACTDDIGMDASTCGKCHQDLVQWGINRWKMLGENPIDPALDPTLYGLVQKAITRIEAAQ